MCQQWLGYDIAQLAKLKLVLALGSVAHNAYLEFVKGKGQHVVKRDYAFKHGAVHRFAAALPMLDTYHVSFQNTNTGKLTVSMFEAVLHQAKELAGLNGLPS
jgi:uracil-DNA glycosylase